MNAVLVKYNPNDRIVSGLLSVLANMNDVEIEDDVWLTDEEIKRIENQKNQAFVLLIFLNCKNFYALEK